MLNKRALVLCFFVAACSAEDPLQPGATPEDNSASEESVGNPVLVPPGQVAGGSAQLRIDMVDVGMGDGLLVRFPNGKVLVIDGGPNGADLSKFLADQGVTRVDQMILTHAHDDHYTGLMNVMQLLPNDCAARVLDPGYDHTDLPGYAKFKTAAGCRYHALSLGQTMNIDPTVEMKVLSAYTTPPTSDGSHGVNNTSVVVHLRKGKFSMLFSGDAEVHSEQLEWMRGKTALRSTILKMGHHGSCTASGTTFLSAVAPRFALISVSTGNTYGLPHCQTMGKLNHLKAGGLRWYRTDLNGSISVTTDGSKYSVTPEHGADSQAACPQNCQTPLDF